jgi:WD40 repeat protein
MLERDVEMTSVFDATPAELYNSLGFEADCTVGIVETRAAPSIASAVQVGDQITKVNDEEVTDRAELRSVLSSASPDKPMRFTVVRSNDRNKHPTSAAEFEQSVALNGNTCSFAPNRGSSKDDAEEEADYRARVDAYAKQSATAPTALKPDGPRPSLVEFDKVTDGNIQKERSFRTMLASALERVPKGRCVIGVGDAQFNPMEEIKILAEELNAPPPVILDFGVKLRHRISKETMSTKFIEAMKTGKWFVVLRSTKSMSLLNMLGALVDELHSNDLKDIDDNARIILSAEPHPHFPPTLTKKSKTLRIQTTFSQSNLMYESIGNSVSALRIVSDQDVPKANKRVKIASAVMVVDIESREVTKTERPAPRPQVNVAGTVKQKATFSALPHDKFFGICFAGSRQRIALASSLGNVYVVDDSGSSLVSFHAHEAAVWDVSFSGEYDFVTGGEDQTAVVWARDSVEKDTLICRDVVKCANDVYAVRYTNSGKVVAVGGLMPKITLRGRETGKVEHVNLPTSNQAMCAIGSDSIVSGGGDGSVFLIDTQASKTVSTCSQHSKKCPAVTATENVVISGSFDCTVRLWDTRATSNQSLHTMKFQHYVTGLAADDNFLTACVGDNLYLWDIRNLSVVLGGQPQAWQGLSRAVVIDAASRTIVTASPDGVARFWSFAAD